MLKKFIFPTGTVILILTLVFLRFFRLYEFVTFLSDQGRDAIILKRIITFEHFPAIGAPSSVGQVYLGPFYYYLIAPFLAIFNFNPVGPAIGVALLSIVGVLFAYLVIKQEFSPGIGLVFMAILTFSSTLTEYSRFSWNPNLLPYFSFSTLYFFYRWVQKPSIKFSVIFGALLGFTIQLHYLGALLLATIMVYFIAYLFVKKNIKNYIIPTLAALTAFFVAILPLVIFDLRHDFLNSKLFIKLFSEGGLSSGSNHTDNLINTINGLVHHGFSLIINPIFSFLIFVAILIWGFFLYIKNKHEFILINLLNLIFFVLIFSMLEGGRFAHYYGPVITSLYLILALLILPISKFNIKIILSTLLIVLFAALNLPGMYFLFNNGNNQIDHARKIAESFPKYIDKQPIQMVTLPSFESDGHYRYFLELKGYEILPQESPDQPQELFIICPNECNPTGDRQWQIAAFSDKYLETSWKAENVTIYKIIHKRT